MFCPKCGAAVSEGEALCPLCGASLTPNEAPEEEISPFIRLLSADDVPEAEAPSPAEPGPLLPPGPDGRAPDGPAPSSPAPPPEAPKKKRAGLFIGLGVAAALILAAVFAVPAIIRALSPAAFVAASLGRTLDAVSAPFRELGLGEVLSAAGKGPTASEFSFNTDLGLSGAGRDGLSLLVESDPKAQKLALDLALSTGGVPFLTLRSYLEHDLLHFASPELFGDAWYSLYTRTIGADFNGSVLCTGDNAMAEDAGFDLFAPDGTGVSRETRAALAALLTEYGAAVTVEKAETGVPVTDGWALSADLYRLTFPADALREYACETLYALLRDDASRPAVLSLIRQWSSSYGRYYYQSRLEALWAENPDEIYDMADTLADRVRGDLTMDFFISDKQVRRVTAGVACTDPGGGERQLNLDVLFGSETSLTDAFGATYQLRDGSDLRYEFTVESEGRHTPVDGVYDDTTRISITDSAEGSQLLLVGVTRYEPAASSDNFSFTLTLPEEDDDAAFSSTGTVLIDPKAKTFSADLESALSARYQSSVNFSTYWSVSPIAEFTARPNDPTPFFSMTEEEYAAFRQTFFLNLMSLIGLS